MKVDDKARALVNYIKSLGEDFQFIDDVGVYHHMGALITDALLQAGINYEHVVLPRVKHVRQHSEARTTSGFLRLFTEVGLNNLLNWKGEKKLRRVRRVVELFSEEGIETAEELQGWLQQADNLEKLQRLKGIGKATRDYFGMLVGLPVVKVDRHLKRFLHAAGIDFSGHDEAREIIIRAADLMERDQRSLDHSIWKYSKSHLRG
jgi:hypothetical protein